MWIFLELILNTCGPSHILWDIYSQFMEDSLDDIKELIFFWKEQLWFILLKWGGYGMWLNHAPQYQSKIYKTNGASEVGFAVQKIIQSFSSTWDL